MCNGPNRCVVSLYKRPFHYALNPLTDFKSSELVILVVSFTSQKSNAINNINHYCFKIYLLCTLEVASFDGRITFSTASSTRISLGLNIVVPKSCSSFLFVSLEPKKKT